MKLLGVSGGPDSMFLLNKYKNKKIFVVHINYNVRKDSVNDQRVVKFFCNKNNIPYKIFELNKTPKNNFQAWARKKRFDFFKEVYIKKNCNKIILGHHKDDFLETALMQKDVKREPKFFGIATNIKIDNMQIYRPLIKKYWKHEIKEKCEYLKIPFIIDSSNEEPIYARNKKRLELKNMTTKEKEKKIYWFKRLNKKAKKKYKKIYYWYYLWEQKCFSVKFFKNLKFPEELLFEFLVRQSKNIKITKKKISSILAFVVANNEAKEYKITKNSFICKKNKTLKIKYN